MDLNILFGSKTKINILKYLLFKEEWISARELESNINQSFSAIKKQIDNLNEAWIVEKNKRWNRWHLAIKEEIKPLIYNIFMYDIRMYFKSLWNKNSSFIKRYFLVDFFTPELENKIWIDIVFIHKDVEEDFLKDLKKQINEFLEDYYFDLKISFMDQENYKKRLRFADRFVINLNKYENFTFWEI